MHRFLRLPAAVAVLIVVCAPLRAQDVELWGRLHGTRPPDAYYERIRQDPDAFEFGRGWRRRTGLGSVDGGAVGGGIDGGAGGVPGAFDGQTYIRSASVTGLGPRDAPVRGTFAFPVLPGTFQDSAEPAYTSADVQREFFDGPASGLRKTISEYYHEISLGNVELVGETFEWFRSSMERSEVTGSSKGLGTDSEVGEFILELLRAADGSVDWGRFDNDGADGIPNTVDDDGFVDVLAVMHPTEGGECQTRDDIIWSHRWRLSAATDSTATDPDAGAGRPFETSTPAAGGGYVKVDDYVVVPLLECEWATDGDGDMDLSHIGVFSHELGHGFGLPDLYGTGASKHSGAGNWDLMATGSWGCNPVEATPHVPCHPGAWTKVAMGWVEVDTIPAGSPLTEITLDPVETSGRVALVETNDGSGEYFLLENRRREGFDQLLPAEGLLIWHVDPGVLASRWSGNRVNADPDHPGVWLRQADGLDDLMKQGGGRGDPGDVFTVNGADEFHAGTVPSAFTHAGSASGLTVTNMRQGLEAMTLDVENRYHIVTLQSDGGGAGTEFLVDGAPVSAEPSTFASAPFQAHVVEAPPGATIEEGIREGFEGWEDGSSRIRDFVSTRVDTTLTASYGGREVHFDVALVSPSSSVAPGTVTLEPGTEDGWVPEGETVRVEAEARTGFDFLEWGGAFEGRTNPFFVSAAGPLDAEARFDLVYSVASNPTRVDLVAATEGEILLQVANGNDPVTWSVTQGSLPEGLVLRSEGGIAGAPLEDGSFSMVLRARDAIGLEADLALDLEVAPPPVGLASLASPLLGGATGLTGLQEAYLDRGGNRNARYDVGDFRAFLQDHPDTPDVAASPASDGATPVVLPPVVLENPSDPSDGSPPSDGSGGGGSDRSGEGGGS